MKNITYQIFLPGGNRTALVHGIVSDETARSYINQLIIGKYSGTENEIEQVGFISEDEANPQLMMAGGEFCGNALRSAACYYCHDKTEIEIAVSGVSAKLRAGILSNGDVWAEMPVYQDMCNIVFLKEGFYLVKMEGISHIVVMPEMTPNYIYKQGLLKEKAEILHCAGEILKENRLLEQSAAGVIFVEQKDQNYQIHPCVYVRDVNTKFYETACGSGTTAVGLAFAFMTNSNVSYNIRQPSGKVITVHIECKDGKIFKAMISGKVETDLVVYHDVINNYRIQRVESLDARSMEQVINLYNDAFCKYPYLEVFNRNEIEELFYLYMQKGILVICIDALGNIVGFSAALPIQEAEGGTILQIAQKQKLVNVERYWYHADLAVSSNHLRQGIADTMVKELMHLIPAQHIIMRTQEGNIASKTLHERLGFKLIKGMEQKVQRKRMDGAVETDNRIFLIYDKAKKA